VLSIMRSVSDGVSAVQVADEFHPEISAIVALIASSPIRVAKPHAARHNLPAKYDDVDIAILEWIAAESRPSRAAATFLLRAKQHSSANHSQKCARRR